ncbi:glycosyltransferase [Luedemannella helvata]|uniref:glycosyltransferase n=1 Tax=Luedemannella helvata TaxID=349315 RepID=UPI0031D23750
MSKVLLIAGAPPAEPAVLEHALGQFAQRGAHVDLACYFGPEDAVASTVPTLFFGPPADHGPHFRRTAQRRRTKGGRVWLYAGHDARLRRLARAAHVLVALDPDAVHTVWQFAQRNRRADARFGLAPALRAVDERAARPFARALADLCRVGPSWAVVRAALKRRVKVAAVRAAVSTAGDVLCRGLLPVGRLPGRRVGSIAATLHAELVGTGRFDQAIRLDEEWARRVADPRVAARLRCRAGQTQLRAGRAPRDLDGALSAGVAVADDLHRAGEAGRAAGMLVTAMNLAFHRGLHFDVLSSPLAADPARFLAPLRRSTAMAQLTASRGRARNAAPLPTDRPARLLFVTRDNDYFLRRVVDHYAAEPGVEVRFHDIFTDEVARRLTADPAKMIQDVLSGEPTAYGDRLDEWLAPQLAWADTVFVDWCLAPAAMMTLRDPGAVRVVVRLHSFEAFSLWPQIMDFTRVDDLVFVSDHLRDLTLDVVPRLRDADAPRTWVIGNAMDLAGFRQPKADAARFTLGMVGFGSIAKDPRWALDVLRLVRERDPRYRMLLIGDAANAGHSVAAGYRAAFEADLAELGRGGAVEVLGRTDDVVGALTQVGVIVSSSVRESFHCGLVEGAASGAVPVVRDWPFFAGRAHGARTLFPQPWVVGDPRAAAERVLAVTATEATWRQLGEAASAHVLSRWDWPVTRREFDQLLLGDADRGAWPMAVPDSRRAAGTVEPEASSPTR